MATTAIPSNISLDELVKELQRREREDPLSETYDPTDKQTQAHRDRSQTLIVQGANRAGKTWFLVAEALLYCLHRPIYAEVPPPPITVWYVLPSMGMFVRVVYPILTRMIPWNVVQSFPTRPNPIITFTNGSQLHFLSADMKYKRLAGAAVHVIIMDETPEETAYNELQARTMSTRGRVILGFLPEDVNDWVDNRLVIPFLAGERADINVIEMPIADEATDEPLVPWFTKADIQAFKLKWPDPIIQAARIYGKRARKLGLVVKNYDPGTHHVAPFDIPSNWTRWLVCDPQYYRFGVLWFAASDNGDYFVTDELFSQSATLRQRAEKMAAITNARGRVSTERALPVYVDSANPQDRAELNWHFEQLGIPLGALPLPFKKVKDVTHEDSMILRLHSMLEPDVDRLYPYTTVPYGEKVYGAPRLFFFDTLFSEWYLNEAVQHCSRLFWEMQKLAWGNDGKPNKRSADGADLTDACMYGVNVMAKGDEAKREDPRLKQLSPEDRLIWAKIYRHDRLSAIARR